MRDKQKQYKRNAQWAKEHPQERAIIESRYYKSLPPIVYRWRSPKGYTAYVGRGTMRRATQHRNSWWYEPDMVLKTLRARNEWHAMKLEGLWGELFQPKHNREGYRR